MLCPIKVNSNPIELSVHTSCYCVLDLVCVTIHQTINSSCRAYNKILTNQIAGHKINEKNYNPFYRSGVDLLKVSKKVSKLESFYL